MPINKASVKNKILLDSSVIIALLKKEPGWEFVDSVLAHSAMSSVNFCELVSVLARSNIPENEIDEITKDIIPEIIPFSEDIAVTAGKLIPLTKDYGLSLGDRACIATGLVYGMEIYTRDRIWLELKDKSAAKISLIKNKF